MNRTTVIARQRHVLYWTCYHLPQNGREGIAIMLIAQISDFHAVKEGEFAFGHFDTNAALERAVTALNELDPQPDLVVCSGDLSEQGIDSEYHALEARLARLRAPYVPVMGNHDRRSPFRSIFTRLGRSFEPDPFIQYVVDLPEIRFVIIDTIAEGSDAPEFCAARAKWLFDTLSSSCKATVLVQHHPPMVVRPAWMSARAPNWTTPIATAIRASGAAVVRVLAGHVHRAMFSNWDGIPCSTCPSTAHQVALRLAGTEPLLSREAAGFQLHEWNGTNLTTYGASFEGLFDVFPGGSSEVPASAGACLHRHATRQVTACRTSSGASLES